MKIKDDDSKAVKPEKKPATKNGSVQKKKKKTNFEVRIPRIIVRNLDFKVTKQKISFLYLRTSFHSRSEKID